MNPMPPGPPASSPLFNRPVREHAGWRSRNYLPHLDSPEAIQHVVFRLKDALPASVRETIASARPEDRMALAEAALDEGHGQRLLADPRAAGIVEHALLHFDGERYRILSWCIMPTHVHALIEQVDGHRLSDIVHSWKSFTANSINRSFGREGTLWAAEYYDRFMRNEEQLERARAYVESNPVAAGLCGRPGDWRFSSAWEGRRKSGLEARGPSGQVK